MVEYMISRKIEVAHTVTEQIIGGKRCCLFENDQASNILIQAIGDHSLEGLDKEVEEIRELAPGHPFSLAAFLVDAWNAELSPWEAPAVFGKESFGSGAKETLAYVTETLMPELDKRCSSGEKRRYYLGGYSLAGLFALWAAYQTNIFHGIAAVSPSVWFPQWDEYIRDHEIHTPRVYLSLGAKEEKTRNKTLAKVGENIRLQHQVLSNAPSCKDCVLEWNPGNHFIDADIRTAKGFTWLLRHQ